MRTRVDFYQTAGMGGVHCLGRNVPVGPVFDEQLHRMGREKLRPRQSLGVLRMLFSSSCEVRPYSSASQVEASSPQDVQNVLRFVRDTGVLVSIKNSGHDFGGRGAQIGSLSIWVRNQF